MDEREFPHWYNEEASQADRALHDKLYDFDDLFADMRFEPDTTSYALACCQSQDPDSGEWAEDKVPLPEPLKYFGYSQVRTKVVEAIDHGLGFYDPGEKLLCLCAECADDDATLLHEMIHMHEDLINELPLYYHDTLLWALYKHLAGKVIGLDDAIDQHAHLLNESDIYYSGGLHDTLFLLKSFDLDMRMGYRLGTVFAYQHKQSFDYLSYEGEPARRSDNQG